MYFSNFPLTFYTLDDNKTVQVVTNTLLRAIFTDEVKNNFVIYDEYDIIDGETPEIVAFKIYGNSELHWIILHINDLLDPRYDWIIPQAQLKDYVESKYGTGTINAIHHYEDSDGHIINGNVIVNSSAFDVYLAGEAVYNQTTLGTGFIISKPSNSQIIVTVTGGGFRTGEQISNNLTGVNKANISSTTIISGIPVTNYIYEELQNENRRRIRILKPQFVQQLINEFQSKMSDINV